MKNIVCYLLIIFSIISCQEDDTVNPSNNRTLCSIQQSSSFYENQPFAKFSYNYIYESGKLVKILESDLFGYTDSIVYIYNSANQLTYTLESYYSMNKLDTTEKFIYNQSNQLTKALFLDDGVATGILTFSYSNGILSQMLAEYTHSNSEKYRFKMRGGNITEYELIEYDEKPVDQQEKLLISYDSGFNPFQYIPNGEFNPIAFFSLRNTTKVEYNNDSTVEEISKSEYKYNPFNYPTEMIVYSFGDTVKSELIYECN